MRRLIAATLGLLGLMMAGMVLAADAPATDAKPIPTPKEITDGLRRLDRALDDEDLSREQMQSWTGKILQYQELSTACEAQAKTELDQVNVALKTLPEDAKNDTPDLKKQRDALNKQVKELSSRGATCALLTLNLSHVSERLALARKRAEEEVLFRRDAPIWSLQSPPQENATAPAMDWREQSRPIWQTPPLDASWVWSIVVLSVGLGFVLRLWVRPSLAGANQSFSRKFFNALFRSAFFHAPLILLFMTSWAYAANGYLGDGSEFWTKVLRVSGIGLMVLVVLESLTLGLAIPEDDHRALRFLRWNLRILYVLLLPWYALGVLVYMAARQEPPVELYIPNGSVVYLTAVLAVLAGAAAWNASRLTTVAYMRWFWRLFVLVNLVVFACDVAGYRLLSRLLMNAALLSLVTLGALRLLMSFTDDFFNALDGGHNEWQRALRDKLGLHDEENIPGVIPLHLALLLMYWAAACVALLRIWGLSDESFRKLMDGLTKGFSIGQLKIVPENILLGVLLFAALMAGFRWLRQRMQGEWVRESKISKGAREAIATIVWYAGVGVAALAGLSLAGIDLSSLAVIAGALSVGIGFGLQNVVSNFISGLILLLERPIRPGDWVVVGGTQGYVQKISIRSTRIKTFDRADVIVPNSEFITSQVTNWMLHDTYGRVVLPIGVAYGSNVEQVRDILLEIISSHPDVVRNDPKVAPPRVLLRGFADSSINFEMRGVIRNVEDMTLVTSDLNFAVEKAFREAGIQIPFPQRELHIRYPDGVPTFFASPVPGVSVGKLADGQ